jgi:basic amino acid/polyamine antiporter, APA family
VIQASGMSATCQSGDAGRTDLRRALGRWDLTAIGVNQVIGGGVFLIPSLVAAQLGAWSAIGFLLVGMASMVIGLCFAEVGSRFDSTGGPYLYARAAFGRFAGFEVGWMQWFTRASAQASVVNGLALALGSYSAPLAGGAGRAMLITVVTGGLAWINFRGIRQSSFVVNLLTIGKVVPLAIFILIGLFFVDWQKVVPSAGISPGHWAAGALLLVFAFGGYEVVPVPAGESAAPRRNLPFALVTTIGVVTLIMALAQTVAQGTLTDVTQSRTPLADSARVFMGPVGTMMIAIASVVSMTGNNAGQVLNGSRMLFALGERGDLPGWFGRIHPRFRTPSNAVLFTSAVALALALSGSFEKLASASAVARLVPYAATSASTIMLRRARYAAKVKPATFVAPLGPLIPGVGVVIPLTIMAGATGRQLLGGLSALVLGALLFVASRRFWPNPGLAQPE